MRPNCISVSAFARFLGRSLITGKKSKNYQPLFFLLKPDGLAAEGQNAQAQHPSSVSLDSGWDFPQGRGDFWRLIRTSISYRKSQRSNALVHFSDIGQKVAATLWF